MAKSRGRKFAEITSPTSGVFDLTSVPTITNAKLQNSAMTLAGSSVSLGGTGVANTDALSEGSSNLYFTNARVQSFLGGGTLAGNVVVPDNRSIYVGSDSDFRIIHNTTNTQLTNATGALQVTSNGGFDVTGASTFSSTVAATGNVTAPNLINIATDSTIQTTTAKQWATIKNTGTGASDYSEMRISNDNNDYLIMGSIGSGYTNANWASSSYIYANRELRIKSQQGLRFYSGGFTHGTNDYMILESAGNLGIGITSGISSKLHVNTEMSLGPDGNNRGIINYSSNILSFGTRQSSTNYFNTLRVTSGKVGIGTDTPNQKLDIEDGHIRLTPGYGIRWETDAGAYAGQLSEDTNNNLLFYAESDGSNPAFVIKNSNRFVGIGESNPDASLHITGNTPTIAFDESDASQDYRIGSYGGTFALYDETDSAYRFAVDGNGNVGIGTTGPNAKLSLGNTTGAKKFLVYDGSTGNNLYAGFAIDSPAAQDFTMYAHNVGAIRFGKMSTDGSTITAHMRIDNGGDVSIGADGVSSSGGNKLSIDSAVNANAATSGTTQTGGALRLRGGDNAVLDFGLNSINAWIQATDKSNLAGTYNLCLNPNTGKVGIGVPVPYADLHIANGTSEWRTSHGGTNLYISNTSWGSAATGDPNFYYGAATGILVTNTDSGTTGPAKPGLTLYNNDNTAGGWSPMLLFAKAESGSSPYKATMAGIYARAPLGTGNSDAWIDGELWFGTSGAATNGVRGRMVLEKEGHLRPALDNNYDLGTTSYRWRNVYTTDLHLSNKVPEGTVGTDGEAIEAGNDVDGTTGDWTIQEGAEDLYIINNSTGKKYKFNLTEV